MLLSIGTTYLRSNVSIFQILGFNTDDVRFLQLLGEIERLSLLHLVCRRILVSTRDSTLRCKRTPWDHGIPPPSSHRLTSIPLFHLPLHFYRGSFRCAHRSRMNVGVSSRFVTLGDRERSLLNQNCLGDLETPRINGGALFPSIHYSPINN